MKGLVLSIALFSILINFSVAIMIDVIPAFAGMDERVGLSDVDGIEEDDTILDEFGEPVNAYQTATDTLSLDRNTLFDRVGLGAVTNLLNFLNKYVFGFVEILRALFGGIVSPILFTGLKTIIGLIYALAAIELFTGKELTPQ
jgi:hypothetical protein